MGECISIGHLLNKASHLMKWELTNQLKAYDLTSAQWAVLMHLYRQECDGGGEEMMTPAVIADTVRVERPAITRIIDKLLKRGLIDKRLNPADGRSQIVVLTSAARELMPKFKSIGEMVVNQSLSGLTKEEIDLLTSLLLQIINNLS